MTQDEYSDLKEYILWNIEEMATNDGVKLDINWGSDSLSWVSLNGVGKDSHEDMFFEFERNGRFCYPSNFCKTNRKPYDKYVWAVLEYLKGVMGNDISISRDA